MLSSPAYWPSSSSSASPQDTQCPSHAFLDDVPYLTDTAYADRPVSPLELPALVAGKITQQVIDYLVDRVCDAVDYGLGRPSSSSSLVSRRTRNHSRRWQSSERATFVEFVTNVLRRAEVTLSAVIGALVYIDRARPHLSIAIEEWAHHRVFLGALIVASKYLNDASLKNAHWAVCSGVCGRRDIQRIEREFLEVLDWELAVTEADLVRICTKMVREGALVRPVTKMVDSAGPSKEVHLEVDGHKNKETVGLGSMNALWQAKHQRRPEKRAQADVDMDVDQYVEERTRRRRSTYTSPASSETCSTCTAGSSPETDSDDSNSPCTPPPPHQVPRSHYAVPMSATKAPSHPTHTKSVSNGSVPFQPLAILDAFPAVPAPPSTSGPIPAIAISPLNVPGSVQLPTAPPPLPSLPPYSAYPLSRAFPGSHPHLSQRPHSSKPASPYAMAMIPTGHGSGTRSRPVTPYSHKRSSAMSVAPSLYPVYMPAVNV